MLNDFLTIRNNFCSMKSCQNTSCAVKVAALELFACLIVVFRTMVEEKEYKYLMSV